MDTLSDQALIVVIQNFQLSLDYQHEKLKCSEVDDEDVTDIEDYLVQADLILGEIRSHYERRRKTNPTLPPVSEIPRIDL